MNARSDESTPLIELPFVGWLPPIPCLVVLASPEADEHGLQFILLSEQATIGRSPECTIALKDPSISRRHISLEITSSPSGPLLSIANLSTQESTTLIGNQALSPKVTGVLRVGDMLRLGHTELRYVLFEHEPQLAKQLKTASKLISEALYEKALGSLSALKKHRPVGGSNRTSLERLLLFTRYYEAWIYSIQGKWTRAGELFQELVAPNHPCQDLRIRAAFQLGALHLQKNDLEQARALADQVWSAAKELADGYFPALVLCLQGMVLGRQRDLAGAQAAFKDAAAHLRHALRPSKNLASRILLESAIAAFLAEQLDLALNNLVRLSEEMDLSQALKVIRGEALRFRGIIHSRRRDFEQADSFLRDALRIFQETKWKFLEYKALKSRAINHHDWGRLEEAAVHLQLCQKLLASDLENEHEHAVVTAQLGKVYLTRGDAKEALRWFERERSLQAGIAGVAHSQGYTHQNFARAHRNLGHREEATRYYTLAVEAFGEISNHVPQGLTLVELCRHRLDSRDVQGAKSDLAAAEHCFSLADQSQDFQPMLDAARAQIAWLEGDQDAALSLFSSSIHTLESSPPNYFLGETYLIHGRVRAEMYRRETRRGDSAAASLHQEEAKRLFDKGLEYAAHQSLGYLTEQFRKEIEALDAKGFVNLIRSRFVSSELFESPYGAITAFSWSPDGTLLATAHADSSLRIWQQDSNGFRRKMSRLLHRQESVKNILWSPDSLKVALVFGSDDDLWIWTLAINREQRPGLKGVRAAAWSRDGEHLHAILEEDRCLRWTVETNERKVVQSTFFHDVTALERAPNDDIFAMTSHSSPELRLWTSFSDMRSIHVDTPMTGLAWSSDGVTLAAFGETTSNIELINIPQARRTGVLQGLLSRARSCEFSPDGQFLLACGMDDSIRVWRPSTLELVAQRRWPLPPANEGTGARLHPRQPLLTVLTSSRRHLFLLEMLPQAQAGSLPATVRQVSAKVVLVGEARVGKTCLALRLAEDRYEEQDSTHGMHFWSLPPEWLDPLTPAPAGERRDVVLWDLGGQEEYRLVHQLFLHDTTLALVLFDPLQGRAAFDAVEAWNKRFEQQLNGRPVVKLLVGTKQDSDTPVDRLGIEALVRRCGFADYFPTSAKTQRGIPKLKAAIARALDWSSLALTSRPDLFQRIQDEIEAQRSRATVVLPMEELEQTIQSLKPAEFDPRAVKAVVEQLALQGVIALTRFQAGDPVMVLQLGEVERYAGSLILAARDNPLGAPAIEQALITQRTWELPLIPREKRLPLREERLVLECVVQLFITHGLCIQHEGLLIFPSLFRATESTGTQATPAVSLSYEFSGAIDNLYSSLVANLALSQQFGRMRLWEDRAEFEETGRGACGLRRVDLLEGTARLEVYFDTRTSESDRSLFTDFVEDHLSRAGVHHTRLHPSRNRAPGTDLKTQYIHENIEEQKRKALNRTKHLFERLEEPSTPSEPLRILHLSDLHTGAGSDVESLLQPLVADLRDDRDGLGLKSLDYLVISGDLTERAAPEEFEQAQRFVSGLIKEFTLTAQRCIIVPGNHDLSWDEENVYSFRMRRQTRTDQLKAGHYVEKGDGYLIRNDEHYPLRFRNFSKSFYHPLMQQAYPLSFPEQGLVGTYLDSGLQVLAFNSSWEIDEHHPHRSGIHSGALSRALKQADDQFREAQRSGKCPPEHSLLRIAVWHHPVMGVDLMRDSTFMERLRQANVRLCLHGHVHEDRADVMYHLHPTRKLHVVGAGSFGAPANHRPESTPRLYNVVEVQRSRESVRVHTRCLRKQGGAWEGWAIWPGDSSSERRSWYEIKL